MVLVEVSDQLEEHLLVSTGRVQDLLPVMGCHPAQLEVSPGRVKFGPGWLVGVGRHLTEVHGPGVMVRDVAVRGVLLVSSHTVHSVLGVPVGVGGPAGSHEGRGGRLTCLVVVNNEPIIVSVTVELGPHCGLEPVDDPAVFSPPARQAGV